MKVGLEDLRPLLDEEFVNEFVQEEGIFSIAKLK